MQYVCDAPDGKTWFRMDTEAEATQESDAMNHAVEKYFRREWDKAASNYVPQSSNAIERDIGRNAFIARTMPVFLTLRDREGNALATAMLPPGLKENPEFRCIVVGTKNGDPYPQQRDAIEALAKHVGYELPWERCYPYHTYLG